MDHIKDIEIINTGYDDNADADVLSGRIVLNQNKFHGIISEIGKNYLIFGSISDERIWFIQSVEENIQYTKLYMGMKDGHMYYGNKYAKNVYVEIPIKECQINVKEIDKISENEITNLYNNIEKKKKEMGKNSTYFYNEVFMKNESEELLYPKH